MSLPHLLVPAPGSTGLRDFGYLVCSPPAQLIGNNGGGECAPPQFLLKLGYGGRHLHVRSLEELEGPSKKRPLWGGGSLEGAGDRCRSSLSSVQHLQVDVRRYCLHAPLSGSDGTAERNRPRGSSLLDSRRGVVAHEIGALVITRRRIYGI